MLAEVHGTKTNPLEENFMNKKVIWLFLVAIALFAAPVSHPSTVSTAGWSFDGTQPPQPPPPWPGEAA
jgi:hypothetical protein